MRQLVVTLLMITALVAFGATAASAGCCAPKCKQHTCTKVCAPKCHVKCAPKCHPCCKPCIKVCCVPCPPPPAPMPEPKAEPCYCCPFAYTIKVFGYELPCMLPEDHPEG